MNPFFRSFFASLLALVVFSFLIVLLIGGLVSSLSKSLESDAVAIEPNSVLMLDLNDAFPDKSYTTIPFEDPFAYGGAGLTGMNDILRSIENAKTNPDIKGIMLKMGFNQNPYASLEEVRRALLSFRNESGKFVIAYGEVVNQSSYYLGSVADEVYLHPAGVFEFKGLAAELTFIKGTLDKLGVNTQVFWAGEYKSATEPLRLDKMSDANREQLRSYIGGMYELMLSDISASRKLPVDNLRMLADSLMTFTLGDVSGSGLIDGLWYEDQLIERMKEKCGLEKDDDLPVIGLASYLQSIPATTGNWDSQVAVVYADGSINDGAGEFGTIGSQAYKEIFKEIREDEEIRSVVIRINSPGGSAIGSEVLWREIMLLKEEKPVVVSMGDYAASGGYMMACLADKVFAQPTTLTGSIGVFFILPEMSGFLEEKLGVTTDTVLTGSHADFPTLTRPADALESARIQALVDETYATFKKMVTDGRKLDAMHVDSIARGRVWLGTDALELGLVDSLGGLYDAIDEAVRMAGLEEYRITEYPRQELTVLEELVIEMAGRETEMELPLPVKDWMAQYDQIRQYATRPTMRAQLPYFIRID